MTFGLHPCPWGVAAGCHSVFDHSVFSVCHLLLALDARRRFSQHPPCFNALFSSIRMRRQR